MLVRGAGGYGLPVARCMLNPWAAGGCTASMDRDILRGVKVLAAKTALFLSAASLRTQCLIDWLLSQSLCDGADGICRDAVRNGCRVRIGDRDR
jgi:hypothetical protein